MTRSTPALLAAAFVVGLPRVASAHDVETDRLWLHPNTQAAELRGQITVNPHYTRADPRPGDEAPLTPAASAAVLALLDRALIVEIDGSSCRPRYEIRELWSPGAPTSGDVVTLRCPLPPAATRLRVEAHLPIDPLIVALQSSSTQTQPVLIRAGASTEFSLGSRSSEPASPGATAWRYLVLGVEHIVPRGLDHVLFVVSLVLGARSGIRRLLIQLTAFTFAHTVTLALGTLGWMRVPASVVEPLIAVSIAAVALDNLRTQDSSPARLWVIFAFGLLHGLGFAGALSETGISGGAFVVGLVSFNFGVELGQLVVVAAVLGALALLRRREAAEEPIVRVSSLAIAAVAAWWACERVFW